ncbi:LemA family protein [Haloarcula japonica]|uniref:LemA protein n=1 Tax=Haloarcula japonica (strain ATCC 49778 / DSM 6131 / JCM 7785 / NBRC 101032 / NCIMB 13157 / TR-1) TaxID=1227453 RepID=M0L8Y6_HALJT|nr:LemA family protein [Haloarcula japonica]EMA29533.1 LemA protein [Haloarcula japonica DSM 6131]
MTLYVYIVGGFCVLLTVWLIGSYFRRAHDNLVEARESCDAAWGNVEVLLQRRHDQVGNLIEIADEYMSMEQNVLAGMVEARESAIDASTPAEAAMAQVDVRESVREFYSIAEETPELRTDEKFDDVRDALETIEQRLENRREYYNDTVRRYNALLQQIPERYLAAHRGYKPRDSFEADEAAKGEFSVRDRLQN